MKASPLVKMFLAICCLLSMPAMAGQCAATFTDGLTNSTSAGSVKFTNYGRLINNPDTVLNTTSVFNNGFATTCTSANCSASGSTVPQLTGFFVANNSNSSHTVNGYSAQVTKDDYKDITVKNGGALYFVSSFSTYKLRKLKVESYSAVYMTPGTYYIDDFEIKGGSVLHVNGSGTVRIYSRSKAKFKDGSIINGGSSGDASKLFLYYHASGGDDKIKVESGAKVAAIMYSANKFEMKGTSDVYGAVSAAGDIHIKNDSWVTYRDTAIANTDFGGSCTNGPAPVHHFLISHDGSGSTCEAEGVTIKACLNADCSSVSTDSISLDFQADGQTKASKTFIGNTTFNFDHTTAETLALSITNATVTPSNATQCTTGSTSSCDIVFTSAGCSSGNTCATTFADAATNSSNSGSIQFDYYGRLVSNPDTVLQSPSVIHSGSLISTCGTGNCTASGSIVPALSGSFETNTSTNNLTVSGQTTTISGNDWQDVSVKSGGRLYMSTSYNKYRIKKLTVEFLSRVYLTPGDYYIDELEVKTASNIIVNGSGTVRLHVKTKAIFKELSLINSGLFGDASKLFVYFHGSKLEIESAATLAGFVYSKGGVELKSYGSIYGAVSAAGQILVKDASVISYRGSAIAGTDFGGACSSSGNAVNHYRFEYDGNGLTCETEQVTIKACANADCSTLYNNASTITLMAATPKPSVADTNITFTGSTTVSLGETAPTTVYLSMPQSSPSASLTCLQNGQADATCDYTTKDTGFIIVNETDNNDTIPTQISGKPSNVGHNAKTITIKAVQTDTQTGSCTALFGDGSNVAIDFAYQCEDPGTCSANPLQILNNSKTYNLQTNGSYSAHNILFSSGSKATIALNYPDVGKIKLHAKKAITLEPGKVTTMQGSSKSFVVRPFGFYMNFSGNPAAQNHTGGVFRRAGEKFDMTLSAVQWQSGDDANGDGHPDVNANLSDNSVTPNFGKEAVAETATITTGLVSPATGNNPTLVNNRFSVFNNGSQSKTGGDGLSWGDVGVVSFTAAGDGDYLGTRENITTTIPYVGRFAANHFRLKTASLTQACANFSYMGQAAQLAINLEAQGVGDIPLLNYDSGAGNHGLGTASFVAEDNNNGNNIIGRLSAMSTSWTDGKVNASYQPTFSRLTASPWIDGPYDNTYIGIKVDDGESSIIIPIKDAANGGANMNAATSADCVSQGNCDALKLHSNLAKFRYGRLNSSEAYGPSTDPLQLPLFTEYWGSNGFVVAADDNCSSLNASDLKISGVNSSPFAISYNILHATDGFTVGTTTIDMTPTNTNLTTLTASSGEFSLSLNPPLFTTGNSGYAPVEVNVNSYPWLQFAWSVNGQGLGETTLPAKSATFGLFRGNDRVIYWRERLAP